MKRTRTTLLLTAVLVGSVATAGFVLGGNAPRVDLADRTVVEPHDLLADRVDVDIDGAPLLLADRVDVDIDGAPLLLADRVVIEPISRAAELA